MTARGTWKRRERDVAKALHGKRIPVTGERAAADVLTPLFCVQVKHGRRRPSYLADWLAGICSHVKDGQVGIVVWCDNREPLREAVVLLRMRDFQDLHGAPTCAEQ